MLAGPRDEVVDARRGSISEFLFAQERLRYLKRGRRVIYRLFGVEAFGRQVQNVIDFRNHGALTR